MVGRFPLTEGWAGGQGGVWVLGLIRTSAAEQSGLQQGDELLEIDGFPVGERSPFQVASQIQGAVPATPAPSSASSSADGASIQPAPFVTLKVP